MPKMCPYCGDCPPEGPCGCLASDHVARLEAMVQKMQGLLNALTTPNVSYFDMTPAEEIARLEARIQSDRQEERARLWQAMKPHWRGDMGPAHILVKEIEHLFNP